MDKAAHREQLSLASELNVVLGKALAGKWQGQAKPRTRTYIKSLSTKSTSHTTMI